MKHGADPYNESKNGDTPLSIAKELKFDDMQRFMSTYKHQVNVSLEEQQEATNSLMQEMQRDNDLHTNQDIAEGSSNHSQANSNSSNQNKRCKPAASNLFNKRTYFHINSIVIRQP